MIRGVPHFAAKTRTERTQALKSDCMTDLQHGKFRVLEQAASLLQPQGDHVLVRCDVEQLPVAANEMIGRKRRESRQLI